MGLSGSTVESKADWRGAQMAGSAEWIYRLSTSEIEELEVALAYAKAKGRTGEQVSREDFPLRGLARKLAVLTDELVDGRGFVLMRGLPVDRYSKEDASTIY